MANSLLKQLLGETETVPEMEQWQRAALSAIHTRFVAERIAGFTTMDGQHFPPASREEAEARWQKVESKFREAILTTDPAVRKIFKQTYGGKGGGLVAPQQLKVSTSSSSIKTCPHCGGTL